MKVKSFIEYRILQFLIKLLMKKDDLWAMGVKVNKGKYIISIEKFESSQDMIERIMKEAGIPKE